MHVDEIESGDLQQLKQAKICYLYLSLPGCPSPSAVSIFPFVLLPLFLLRDFFSFSRWWRSRRGEVQEAELEVEEGGHSVGGWEEL